jgi:hypothetical protein
VIFKEKLFITFGHKTPLIYKDKKIERWERLSQNSFFEFVDAWSLLNEFAMMWALRERSRCTSLSSSRRTAT